MNIVLVLPISDNKLLPAFVDTCFKESVELIAICGTDSDKIEDEIDWLLIDDDRDQSYPICTTSHRDQKVSDVVEFATGFGQERTNPTKIVRL